jgi:hypothetical protein
MNEVYHARKAVRQCYGKKYETQQGIAVLAWEIDIKVKVEMKGRGGGSAAKMFLYRCHCK